MSGGGGSRFPATMRLKHRKDFQAVYRDGAVWKGHWFSLHVLEKEEGKRIGIVIPRKWGTAVERNRMKRRLRDAFRRNAHLLPNADIIIKPQVECRDEPADRIGRMLVDAVTKIVQTEVADE